MTLPYSQSNPAIASKPPIVCFSHIPWNDPEDSRPRQVMSHLARVGYPVYYFECIALPGNCKSLRSGNPINVSAVNVFTIKYPARSGPGSAIRRWLAGLKAARIVRKCHIKNPVLWYYHPLLFALGYSYADSAVVYEVTRNFSSGEVDPQDYYFEELTIIAEADIVFAADPALENHVRSLVADLAEDGTYGIPPADIHCLPAPPSESEWSTLAADIDVALMRNIEVVPVT